MIKFIKSLLLKREAVLFDTPLFIVKSFIAVMLGFVLFNNNSFLGKDMISLLLGLMLTLQPVNVSGLKSGWDQISASIIGGGITALIVVIGGINFITVPLAVAVTLYITLRINWRSMSVIAVFTSIYMTQFIQLTAVGEPSMYLTFRLRLFSMGTGILIAVLMNFIFSLVFYRTMIKKRTVFVIEQLVGIMKDFSMFCSDGKTADAEELKKRMVALFGDIDYVLGSISDIRRKKTKAGITGHFIEILGELRNINHFILDIAMDADDKEYTSGNIRNFKNVALELNSLNSIIQKKAEASWEPGEYNGTDRNVERIYGSMRKISLLAISKA